MSRSHRRSQKKDKAIHFEVFRQQRNARGSRLEQYQIEEEDIYDEIGEDEYKARLDEQNSEEEFVVDDDGRGYVDYGMEEVEQPFSDEQQSEDDSPKQAGSKRKRSKKSEKKKQEPTRKIETFFLANNPTRSKPTGPLFKIENKCKDNDEGDQILEDIFNYLDEDDGPSRKIAKIDRAETNVQKEDHQMFENNFNYLNEDDGPSKKIAKIDHTEINVQKEDQQMFENDLNHLNEDDGPSRKIAKIDRTETDVQKEDQQMFENNLNYLEADDGPSRKIAEIDRTETNVQKEDQQMNKLNYLNENEMIVDENQTAYIFQTGSNNYSDCLEENGTLRMYWFDAYQGTKNGTIYLFGKILNKKTKEYLSCCVTVRGLERSFFVLPRSHRVVNGNTTDVVVTMNDIKIELQKILQRYKITTWASKVVSRKYCFEMADVPSDTNYLKVVYSYSLPGLPNDLSGETFSHIFGANRNPLELFIIKRKIMGPCWLEIQNPDFKKNKESYCRVEAAIMDPKFINPLKGMDQTSPKKAPPMTIMSISLKTVLNRQRKVNEIVLASLLIYPNVSIEDNFSDQNLPRCQYTAIRPITIYPIGFHERIRQKKMNIEILQSEKAILNYLLAIIARTDPDVLVGHNFIGFDLDILLHRMKEHKVQEWSKIGRLHRSMWPKLQSGAGGMSESTYDEKAVVSGRLICDTYLNARELKIKSKNYTLTDLASSQLHTARREIDFTKVDTYFTSTDSLTELIFSCLKDAQLTCQLTFKLQLLPLTKELTSEAGNLWSRTLTGSRAERNEYLLLHEFHKNKYICPDKHYNKGRGNDQENLNVNVGSRRKPAYSGGLVFDPKSGLYDKYVLMLDFNSLYPSIIQEYNICFTTHKLESLEESDEKNTEIPDSNVPRGILPKLLAYLVERRRRVKRLMKDPNISETQRAQFDIRQQALKLTANSMYGCLGFAHSRFYAKELAMLITSKGREILQNTRDLAENEQMEVIYGDTDSIMINTNETDLDKAREMGYALKKKINQRYKLMEIDLDAVYERLLLLKKKKYAAIIVEAQSGKLVRKPEMKGLDLVRRDWCELSQDVSKYVLEQILSVSEREEILENIHKYLAFVAEQTRSEAYPLEKFIINKNLAKNPTEYADAKSQPHVQVALRRIKNNQSARVGETIPYIICKGDESNSNDNFAGRAYHPDEIKNSESLKIDSEWYLYTQIHPCVSRLCEPLEGTDSVRIAACLGLETQKFRSGNSSSHSSFYEDKSRNEERFADVEKFQPSCRYCKSHFIFEPTGIDSTTTGISCGNPECKRTLPTSSLVAQINCQIKSHIQRYYDGWFACDEMTCRHRTRTINSKCQISGCPGLMTEEYSDKMLYTQLLYYSKMFDKNDSFKELKNAVDRYLDKCQYRYVDLSRLFRYCQI
ncbi:12204_t:CDS:10 [Ambispora leptoticha]|uniref:DNA polymerase n=1 Tax=Ambispora leptoticha TaxID=144679 RepID=A0A9N9B517_9GLOM|nr:12204_t:CDS:10 [Ambispora leptoticha]